MLNTDFRNPASTQFSVVWMIWNYMARNSSRNLSTFPVNFVQSTTAIFTDGLIDFLYKIVGRQKRLTYTAFFIMHVASSFLKLSDPFRRFITPV